MAARCHSGGLLPAGGVRRRGAAGRRQGRSVAAAASEVARRAVVLAPARRPLHHPHGQGPARCSHAVRLARRAFRVARRAGDASPGAACTRGARLAWAPGACAARGRLFLKKLKSTLKIPVLALVDSDPYGLKILSVYMKARSGMPWHGKPRGAARGHVSCASLRAQHASVTR
jgi:hypothetical protein